MTKPHNSRTPRIPVRGQVPAQAAGKDENLPSDGLPSDGLLETLREARLGANALLETRSAATASVDYWEALAADYGQRQIVVPPDVFLAGLADEFSRLCGVMGGRRPVDLQRRLYRVMAQLAGLIGFSVMGCGAFRESHSWYRTARAAAEETGDRQLKAWLMACQSMTYFWDANLAEQAAPLCLEAEAMAGGSPTAAGALAASIAGRAYARIGRRTDALNAMSRAERAFEQLDSPHSVPTRFGIYEGRLRYDQENALTRLGDVKAAMDVQERALTLCEGSSMVEASMVKLDHASCLMLQNEMEEGYSVARRALDEVSRYRGHAVILLRLKEIANMWPPAAGTSGELLPS